jgi:hypothetical protein
MGAEYNQLGEMCDSRKQAKGRKFVWAVTAVLGSQVFGHEQQVERKKGSLELEQPWRENLEHDGANSRVYLKQNIEESFDIPQESFFHT